MESNGDVKDIRNIRSADSLRDSFRSALMMGRVDDEVVLHNPPTFEWEPDERERLSIMLEIADFALGTADNCGADSEEATEARKFYFSLRDKSLAEAKGDIQGYFFDLYEAVMGDIDRYYDKWPELRRLIRLTLGIKGDG